MALEVVWLVFWILQAGAVMDSVFSERLLLAQVADSIRAHVAWLSRRAAVPNRSMNSAGASEFAGTGREWLLFRAEDGRSGRCSVVCSVDQVVGFVGVTGKGAS